MKLKKTPQRTCVGCRQVKGKKELLRVVRDPEGNISVDVTGKRSGRGAYICPSAACLEEAVKGKRLDKALLCSLTPELVEILRKQVVSAE